VTSPFPTPRREEPVPDRSWPEQTIMIVVLTVMALADAYQFWIALQQIIQRAPYLTLFFVLALVIGAVVAAHIIGRLVRSRREAFGGSVGWIALVLLLWLGLGSALAWIRLHHDSFALESTATGYLAEPVTDSGVDTTSLQMAVLLLILYLLTGAVAMTHAYRFGDPRSAEVRRALRERRRLAAEVARLAHLHRLAEAELRVREADRERDRQQHEREQGMHDSRNNGMRTEADLRTAGHLGDPQATDALTFDGQGHSTLGGDA
jgi:uncharacterized membrane protein YidH (DUF202 family)